MSDERNHRIDYIEFGASDLTKIKAFYARCFEWVFTDHGPDYTAFTDGQLDGGFAKQPTGKGPLVVIYASKLEETKARVEANGGRIVRDIFSFPGGRRFHFEDPSGNELAVWSE